MLQNESVSDWLKLTKTNSANIMQTIAEKKLNPNHYHLSAEAKKRLSWIYLIHQEKGNISKTSRKAGLSRQWLSHLNQVFENSYRDPRSLEPKSRAPHNTSNRQRIAKETEKLILQIRDMSLNSWGKDKIAKVLQKDYGIKINPNTINNCLHNHGRIDPKISLKNTKAFKEKKLRDQENILLKVKFRPPKAIKDYAPGALMEKDMKYLAKPGQQYAAGKHKENFWYQFTEIDSLTRIRTMDVSDKQDTQTAIALHKRAVKKLPFKIACENTDNGFENNNDFSKTLKQEEVFHFYSNTATPTDNPRVERSHLTDDLEFYSKGGNICNDLEEQKKKTKEWERFYNFKRPHQALSYLTPMEFYALWESSPQEAYVIVEKWQEYLKKQRLRQASSRRIKKKEQIESLMNFIDAKLKQKKDEVEKAQIQLINCQLCSVA